MLSRFFVNRPIFAIVIALVIMLAGALSIVNLPVAQYPDIALPQVSVNASYPGATAQTVEDSVTQVLEQGMNGLDGLKYITGNSSQGSGGITLVFEAGTDPNVAQVQVQNKISSVISRLPQPVQAQGVRVNKASGAPLLTIALTTTDGSLSNADLSDYLATHIVDPISRIDGVGDVNIFGAQYAMRIWLNADRLAQYRLTPADIVSAIRAQNAQVSAGSIGAAPTTGEVGLTATISAQSLMTKASQFEAIIVRANPEGTPVYLRDVARVELGSEAYGRVGKLNGFQATGMQVRLATGANALATAERVKAEIERLKIDFPPNMTYAIPNDSTQFVKIAIEDVVKTLIEAIVLVFLVMYLFLQNWRATLIPTIAVPVVLLGTFAILLAFGYSINTLTMFGLVLAIGLLVDDAIVVVENVERVMHEEGLSPREATLKSMDEITGALIGVASVLAAMFVPMAFFGGTQGIIYRQFSITLVSAMALSVVVALVLTPPLCATLLKAPSGEPHRKRGLSGLIDRLFSGFNVGFEKTATTTRGVVGNALARPVRFVLVYLALIGGVILLFVTLPTSFLPDEDQGLITNIVQLPTGAPVTETQAILDRVSEHYRKEPSVMSVFTVTGFSFGGSGENMGMAFVRMKPFSERPHDDDKVFAVVERAKAAFAPIRTAIVIPTIPPAVRELGNSSGFDFVLKDTGGLGHDALMAARSDFLRLSGESRLITGVRAAGQEDTPQLRIDIDPERASAMGVTMSDINTLLSTALGGAYVNDFIDQGRIKRVYVQADAPFRQQPDDIRRFFARNSQGEMVPFSALADLRWTFGPPRLERYNGTSSIQIQGTAAPGVSNGAAMTEVERLVEDLPEGITMEWTGVSLQERESGAQAPALYALSLLVVFLLLAALYESWTIPFAVILVVPLGVLGALLATFLRGLDNDIYFQVGLLATMGLSAKNAILIVEFARTLHDQGHSLIAATLEAVRIRLRPIIMTSLAFTFGIMPLALAHSAGSASQHAIGTGLIGGVISATVLAVIFVPLFFVLVQKLFHGERPGGTPTAPTEAEG